MEPHCGIVWENSEVGLCASNKYLQQNMEEAAPRHV